MPIVEVSGNFAGAIVASLPEPRVKRQLIAHISHRETFSLGNKEAQRPNVPFIHLHQLSMKIFLGLELMAS